MAKDKDKQQNPAAVALKKQKQAAVKKSKANLQAQRHEKLARRNPERLQRQIDDLKGLESAQGGNLRPRDKQQLEQLERDVKAIKKARDERPEQARQEGRGERGGRGGASRGGGRGGSSLGKRRRDSLDADASSDTDPEVRSIPMPRDTPPPVPPRPRRQRQSNATNANDTPISNPRHIAPEQPVVKPVAQTTYSSAPQVRNLQKEATAKFVPAAVAARLKQRQAMQGKGGDGRLLEPEEVDRLEKDGYLDAEKAADEAAKEEAFEMMAEENVNESNTFGDLDAEEAAFRRELREKEGGDEEDGPVAENSERRRLAGEAREDAKKAAVAEMEETEYIANAELAGAAPADAAKADNKDGRRAHTQLRLVEVEDVSDDEW